MKTKIHHLILFIVFALFTLENNQYIKAENLQSAVSYEITVNDASEGIANIKAKFTPVDNKLTMFPGANNFPDRWAKFVTNLEGFDAEGTPISISKQEGANWVIDNVPASEITLTYQLKFDHENFKWSGGVDGAAYTRDDGLFFTGRSLFIVNGEDKENIAISFNLPDNWKSTTPWLLRNNQPHQYLVHNYSELYSAMVFVGTHIEVPVKRGSFELLMALSGDSIIQQQKEFIGLAEGVFSYYEQLMKAGPKLSKELKSNKATLIISEAATTDGEALGNNISILLQPNPDEMASAISRFIFAHEFYHLWNGKSFVPQKDDTEWFKEGFSNYYTLKSLHHVGFLTDESYLTFLGDFFYQRYATDEGLGSVSMSDGEKKHNHWGIIYAGGFFVALAQDIQIRLNSNNTKNIDDLMRTLHDRFDGDSAGYNLNDLKIEMNKLNGSDQSEFFAKYITGAERLPLEEYLNKAGMTAVVNNNKLQISIKKELTELEKNILEGIFGKR